MFLQYKNVNPDLVGVELGDVTVPDIPVSTSLLLLPFENVPPFGFHVILYSGNADPVLVAELELPYPDLVALTVAVADDP